MRIIEERLRGLETITIAHGAHESPDEGMCAMEAAAWIAGEEHTDHPKCVRPAIAAFMRSWNDALGDEDRGRITKPLIPLTVGTATTDEDNLRCAWMAIDWQIRVQAVTWLRLTPSLGEHADRLAALPEITAETWSDVRDAVQSAWAAAWDASRAAAWDAAWDAAGAAAWDAARAAAGDAAGDAAGAAAWAAARAAAWAALKPTIPELQASAQDLVRRMCEVGR